MLFCKISHLFTKERYESMAVSSVAKYYHNSSGPLSLQQSPLLRNPFGVYIPPISLQTTCCGLALPAFLHHMSPITQTHGQSIQISPTGKNPYIYKNQHPPRPLGQQVPSSGSNCSTQSFMNDKSKSRPSSAIYPLELRVYSTQSNCLFGLKMYILFSEGGAAAV